MKSIFASHLLFKAGLIVLLSLELDECLSAMDSDSEVHFEIQYYICAKHGDFKPVFLKRFIFNLVNLFAALFSIGNVKCFLRVISSRDSHFNPHFSLRYQHAMPQF